jgi:hypothetical protein
MTGSSLKSSKEVLIAPFFVLRSMLSLHAVLQLQETRAVHQKEARASKPVLLVRELCIDCVQFHTGLAGLLGLKDMSW